MILIITGGRDYKDYKHVKKTLDMFKIDKIIQGGANGADFLARRYAEENNIPCVTYKADWELHGRSAGPKRNEKMLRENREATLIAFKGGKGTASCIKIAEELKMMRIC